MTPMRVKLDEDLSPIVGEPLRERGHVVLTVVEQGWGGLADEALFPLIKAEHILFITADKGFGDIRVYPPGTHDGIVLLRADRESLLEFQNLIRRLIESHPLESLAGAVTVVTSRSVRVRRTGKSR